MFVFRNYNRFLQHYNGGFHWEDLFIHRFKQDWDRLVKFDTRDQAEAFLTEHPKVEIYFDAWIVEYEESWD